VSWLIDSLACLFVGHSNNATALHFIARIRDGEEGLLAVLKLLVEKGADVNALNHHGNAPLHEASVRDAVQCATFLLANQARVDNINSYVAE
jgi:ankyrin repeat protein